MSCWSCRICLTQMRWKIVQLNCWVHEFIGAETRRYQEPLKELALRTAPQTQQPDITRHNIEFWYGFTSLGLWSSTDVSIQTWSSVWPQQVQSCTILNQALSCGHVCRHLLEQLGPTLQNLVRSSWEWTTCGIKSFFRGMAKMWWCGMI